MNAVHPSIYGHSQLDAIRARFRELTQTHDWLASAIPDAVSSVYRLVSDFRLATTLQKQRERHLAREQLKAGQIFDPRAKEDRPNILLRFHGLCPVALAAQLREHRRFDTLPPSLEKEVASTVLEALDRDSIYTSEELTDKQRAEMADEFNAAIEAGTHVSIYWAVVTLRPDDRTQLPDPLSVERADLQRLSMADYHIVAMYWLSGLADAGATRPLVPEPKGWQEGADGAVKYVLWRERFPIKEDQFESDHPLLDSGRLPVEVAKQMLAEVERMVRCRMQASHSVEAPRGTGGRKKVPEKVILWEGAEVSDKNIKLARVRTAFLETGGSVRETRDELRRNDISLSTATIYRYLNLLDELIPGWRRSFSFSQSMRNRENLHVVRSRQKSRDQQRKPHFLTR